jgi:hypothetical protein
MVRELEHFFRGLDARLKILRKHQREFDRYLASGLNVFSLLGADENRLSDVLADLLDPAGTHGQGRLFLVAFIRHFDLADWKYPFSDDVRVRRERTTTHIIANRRRVDIEVTFGERSAIAIENKPWAVDQVNQIPDYLLHLDNKYHERYVLIYLSGSGSQPDINECSAMLIRKLRIKTYRDLRDWLGICRKECESDKVRWLLADFMSFIEEKFEPLPSEEML